MEKYLISIETDQSERLNRFFNQPAFNQHKSNLKKIGVVGRELTVSEYYRLGVAQQSQALSPGELGCTLSHVEALKDFIKTESKYALILEDDLIQINNIDLDDIFENIENMGLKNCFFLSLCGIQLQVNNKIRGKILNETLFNVPVLKLHRYYVSHFCYTCAYVVDRDMAKLLIDYHTVPHICDHWDQLHLHEKNYHFYASYVFDHPEISNIENQSSIERERAMQLKKAVPRKSAVLKLKTSILKKWIGLFNNVYPTHR